MPTKRIFDLVIITGLLLHPAVGLVRMASRRWISESDATMGTVGAAALVAL